MYTPRTSVEAIPNASIHHSALQNRDFGHTYDRSRALVKALARRGRFLQKGHFSRATTFAPKLDTPCLKIVCALVELATLLLDVI